MDFELSAEQRLFRDTLRAFVDEQIRPVAREWEASGRYPDEIVATIAAVHPLEPVPARGSAPADRWRYLDGRGEVGVIPTVTRPFCGDCDRTRLTADGQVRSCLFSREETDLRGLMRAGADDAAVEAAWRAAMWAKPAGHGINDPDFVQPDRPMSAIGG
jgi:cyclic pyranopterin phosphate synthase